MRDYIVIDLETTGLSPDRDQILEIGAVKVSQGKVTETYASFLDPEIPVPGRITQITGITQDMVMGQPKAADVLPKLMEFCGDLPLLGHNLIFDYGFVKCCACGLGIGFEKNGMDTLSIARKVLPDLESRSLQYLRKFYGIPQENEHRALEDARTTYFLYEKLYEEFWEKNPGAFQMVPLVYKVKKQSSITNAQKGYLRDLIKYHRIEMAADVDNLTKSEASKMIDGILSSYGRIKR